MYDTTRKAFPYLGENGIKLQTTNNPLLLDVTLPKKRRRPVVYRSTTAATIEEC